jgi:hypothetical protein
MAASSSSAALYNFDAKRPCTTFARLDVFEAPRQLTSGKCQRTSCLTALEFSPDGLKMLVSGTDRVSSAYSIPMTSFVQDVSQFHMLVQSKQLRIVSNISHCCLCWCFAGQTGGSAASRTAPGLSARSRCNIRGFLAPVVNLLRSCDQAATSGDLCAAPAGGHRTNQGEPVQQPTGKSDQRWPVVMDISLTVCMHVCLSAHLVRVRLSLQRSMFLGTRRVVSWLPYKRSPSATTALVCCAVELARCTCLMCPVLGMPRALVMWAGPGEAGVGKSCRQSHSIPMARECTPVDRLIPRRRCTTIGRGT